MVSLTLLSTVLMGLLVVVTFFAAARIGLKRKPPVPSEGDRYDRLAASLGGLARSPTVWTLTFIVFAVGAGVIAVVAVGDFGLSEPVAGTLLGVVYALVGLLLAGFIFAGAYGAARQRGLGNAHGIAAGTFMLGLVFLLVIAAQLVVGVIG